MLVKGRSRVTSFVDSDVQRSLEGWLNRRDSIPENEKKPWHSTLYASYRINVKQNLIYSVNTVNFSYTFLYLTVYNRSTSYLAEKRIKRKLTWAQRIAAVIGGGLGWLEMRDMGIEFERESRALATVA
ncbi:unnamed protein product [Fraxinus pennsylvanica]|uniref:Uncharacterized protein n=1 Tax=Fraxinus pennsylvanica TaxID=56036 RepID=A0AAD2DLP0_9LAMI|nr:unnamed protein product [Fraxinus pennsylvanica]